MHGQQDEEVFHNFKAFFVPACVLSYESARATSQVLRSPCSAGEITDSQWDVSSFKLLQVSSKQKSPLQEEAVV